MDWVTLGWVFVIVPLIVFGFPLLGYLFAKAFAYGWFQGSYRFHQDLYRSKEKCDGDES